MNVYLIAYSLAKPAQQTKNIWDALTALGAKRVQDTVWALRSSSSAAQIQKHLWSHVGLNGRLLVANVQSWDSWNPICDIGSV